ncbi:MAG: PspC domain-containing protein [Anaerolineae bacterium]|nr:PspC domain-containing protein [Anaerolineae bacterium]
MNTQFYRSNSDRMIGGVCGGIARYLQIDSTLVRLFFVLLTLADGVGAIVYLILWIIMPDEVQVSGGSVNDYVRDNAQEISGRAQELAQDIRRAAATPHPQTNLIIGAALIILGGFWLADNLNIAWLHWLDADIIWGVLLVVGGILVLTRRPKEK